MHMIILIKIDRKYINIIFKYSRNKTHNQNLIQECFQGDQYIKNFI